jgi:hypothetical protein
VSLAAIRDALEGHLALLADLPPVGWEDVAFEPDDGEAHLLVFLIPAPTQSRTVGSPEITNEQGILQVSVRTPPNRGPRPAETLAMAVRDHFPKGLGLSSGGVGVSIQRRGSVTPARRDGGWRRIDVSIPYFSNVFHAT